jgi:AraC-like DNA-binding protein
MHAWGNALMENGYEDVAKEAVATIREHSRHGTLSSEWLQRFYQNFVQMISLVLEQKGLTMSQLFVSNDELVYEGNQVRQGIRYIHNHLEQNIRRDDVARAVFLHPNYLSRIFREETGIPLKEFIIQEKMNLAQQLLLQTPLPVSSCAARGYQNFFPLFAGLQKGEGKNPTRTRHAVTGPFARKRRCGARERRTERKRPNSYKSTIGPCALFKSYLLHKKRMRACGSIACALFAKIRISTAYGGVYGNHAENLCFFSCALVLCLSRSARGPWRKRPTANPHREDGVPLGRRYDEATNDVAAAASKILQEKYNTTLEIVPSANGRIQQEVN